MESSGFSIRTSPSSCIPRRSYRVPRFPRILLRPKQRAGRFSPARQSIAQALLVASVPSTASASALATTSRRAALPVAVAAIHRTVGRWLKRKLVDLFSAISAFQIKMPNVNHPSLSKTHSISFCGLEPRATLAGSRARVRQRYPTSRKKGNSFRHDTCPRTSAHPVSPV